MNHFKLNISIVSILLIIPLFSIGQNLKNAQEISLDTTTTDG
jgi:hypothetical protein